MKPKVTDASVPDPEHSLWEAMLWMFRIQVREGEFLYFKIPLVLRYIIEM
jgi:hypothetical protein